MYQSTISTQNLKQIKEEAVNASKVFNVDGYYMGVKSIAPLLMQELGKKRSAGILQGNTNQRETFIKMLDAVIKGRDEESKS